MYAEIVEAAAIAAIEALEIAAKARTDAEAAYRKAGMAEYDAKVASDVAIAKDAAARVYVAAEEAKAAVEGANAAKEHVTVAAKTASDVVATAISIVVAAKRAAKATRKAPHATAWAARRAVLIAKADAARAKAAKGIVDKAFRGVFGDLSHAESEAEAAEDLIEYARKSVKKLAAKTRAIANQ